MIIFDITKVRDLGQNPGQTEVVVEAEVGEVEAEVVVEAAGVDAEAIATAETEDANLEDSENSKADLEASENSIYLNATNDSS